MLTKHLICVTGLPRAGSTLLCQLLAQHPHLHSPGQSSPLCPTLVGLRKSLSDDPFLLAQMDLDAAKVHRRLLSAFQGWINGWFAEAPQDWVVDKNRAWMHHLELLHLLDPECRLLVCVRELGQIWGSIETQHRQTLLFDFSDHLAQLTPIDRADRLFAADGVIGGPLRSLEAIQDREADLQSRLYYVVYEHLISDPQEAMQGVYAWLGLPSVDFDPQQLSVYPTESDSHYRYKYPHQLRSAIEPHPPHGVPPRITASLHRNFRWFYELFYPGLLGA
ncbi:MAG TPA: sulfotransferase [Coleofasciculaceae cyanobacterium]